MHAPSINLEQLRQERLVRLQNEMRRQSLGGLYLTENASLLYTVNLKVPGGSVFVPQKGEPILYVRPRDEGYCRQAYPNIRPTRRTSLVTREGYADRVKRWAQELKETLDEFGFAGESLGVDHLEAAPFFALQAEGVDFMDGNLALLLSRSVKTPQEILCFRKLGGIYGEVMRAVWEKVTPGVSERRLYGLIHDEALQRDVSEIFQLNVCSGENMNPWRRWPTERSFKAGEFVGIDLHMIGPGGCWGDISRTYLCGGTRSGEQRSLYGRAKDYLDRVIDLLRPGESIDRLVERLPPVLDRYRALLQNYSIAHSVGMRYSEYPNIDWKRPLPVCLEENMVFAVESYFGEVAGGEAVKLEEIVLIGEKGAEILTDAPYDEKLG
jgi:Xaa-Pro aminopeptidase